MLNDKRECIKGVNINIHLSSQIINEEYQITEIIKTDNIQFINETIEEIKIYANNVDINNIIENLLNFQKNETKEINKEEEIKAYDKIMQNVEDIFTSENYDTPNLDKGEDQVITTEKMTITLSTTQNQINNKNNNMTLLDLGECEILLRAHYNISSDKLLYMKKLDIKQ